jgi:hypothetical protein
MQVNTKAIIRKVQWFMLPWLWLLVVSTAPLLSMA